MRYQIVAQRPSYPEINLDHLTHNLCQIRDHVHVKIMAIVKENAYLQGLVQVAQHL